MHGTGDCSLADCPAGPLHPRGDAIIAWIHGRHYPVHQEPDDLTPVCGRRRRGLPERRHFSGQTTDTLAVGRAQGPRLHPAESVELSLQLVDRLERLFPASLQGPCHQPVLRLARLVLPGGPIRLVPRPLDPLLPVPDHLPPALLDFGRRVEARLRDGGCTSAFDFS